MYFCSFSLVFFLFAQKLYATEVCISSTPCKCVLNGGQVIDLTSVGLIQRPRFSEILHNGTEHFYSYNPCYPFDSPDKYTTVKDGNKPCTYAAGCVKSPGSSSGNAPEEHAVGMQDTFKFDFINGIAYINYSVPGAKQTLSVKLECDNSTESHNLNIDDPETDVNSHVVMTLKSKCACFNGCGSSGEPDISSGLSTGSKLIIAFFTITLAYFIIGMVYNFCNGAQGVELVPNLDFWNELPKLIIEGVAFSVSCCGKKSSYGEVS